MFTAVLLVLEKAMLSVTGSKGLKKKSTGLLKEQDIKNLILDWFLTQDKYFAWPNDSVGIWDPRGFYRKKTKRHLSGVSDILGIERKTGRFIAIEVKSKTGVLSKHQLVFLTMIIEMGGYAIIARSLDDVLTKLEA